MDLDVSNSYQMIDERVLQEGTAVAWISNDLTDVCWDKFLQQTPLGQFQQSTMWARAKQAEGWKPVRVLVVLADEIVAGFQILWQSSWRGRLGYVSKGPVVLPMHRGLADFVIALLRQTARNQNLTALVVQPPDLCEQTAEILASNRFMLDVVAEINDATWIIDLRNNFDAIEQETSKQTRRKIKQALSRGVTVREGGREDLRTFFDLMLSTCKRQRTAPVPSDVQSLEALWDMAKPAGFIRLTFAECEQKQLAGLISIVFGRTVNFWRRGWSSSEGERHPNELLMYEALKWADSNGYRLADFGAFDVGMALNMLLGEPLTPEQEKSRHTFHVRFGGRPRLLPEARIFFPNPVIRTLYRLIFRKKLHCAHEKHELVRRTTHVFATQLAQDSTKRQSADESDARSDLIAPRAEIRIRSLKHSGL